MASNNRWLWRSERQKRSYLAPHACLSCRKSFKRRADLDDPTCAVCKQPVHRLSLNFKPPKQTDVAQWEKVRFLVEHGFRFQSVYEVGNTVRIPYPETPSDAREFVAAHKDQAIVDQNSKNDG